VSKPKIPTITEAAFTAQVLALAKLTGWRSAHFRPARTAAGWRTAVQGDGAGFPDLVLLKEPWLVVAELKRSPREDVPQAQRDWLQAFFTVGAYCYLWTPEDWKQIEDVLTNGPKDPIERTNPNGPT
jgi:hypothetical protein